MDEEKVKEETKKIIGKGRIALRYGVNIFVYTIVGVFMLLMIFFSISQTSFFKSWLRDKVVEIVNDGINGKLSIEEIDGTIFTSVLIKNATLTSLQNDTVITAGNIELRTSPLKLLFKDIYIRKFELSDAKIKLVMEEDGELNLLKIFPPSNEPDDTSKSVFPFAIEAADFSLSNIDFSLQQYDKLGSNEYYTSLTTDDLRIKNLNVSLSAFADLNKYAYRLTINNISFSPNFNFFKLKSLSGSIFLSPQLAGINKLHLETRDSEVELSAAISGLDFLNDFSMEKLSAAPIRLTLNAPKLNFEDISTYVPTMALLSGTVNTDIEASGTFSELLIKKLSINYNNTAIRAKANLESLLNADRMNFDLIITDSYIDPSDPNKLLRNIDLPDYKEFGVVRVDTLSYRGSPLNFNSAFVLRTDKGNLNGTAAIDLRKADMIYEAKLITKNLDLTSFISIPTDINSEININGVGLNLQKMKSKISLNAADSKFGQKYFKNISLITSAENGAINTSLNLSSDSTSAEIFAKIDFANNTDPVYELKGNLSGINLAKLLNNQSFDTELSLSIDASGQGFNPDSMDLFLVTDIKNSRFMDFNIDSTRLIMDIRRNDNGKKIINVISEIADLTISGDYKVTALGDIVSREIDIIKTTISEKINPVFFPDSLNNLTSLNIFEAQQSSMKDFSLEYLLDFKESMNINIGKDQLEIDGIMNGIMESQNKLFVADLLARFDYFKYWNDENVFFIVNSELNCNLSNNLANSDNGNLIAKAKFNSERIYAGGNIHNLSSMISFENNKLIASIDGKYEDNIKAKLNTHAFFNGQDLEVEIQKFNLNYNDLNISNNKNILLSYTNQKVTFDDLTLQVADGTITASGSFGAVGDHNAIFNLESLSGKRILRDILGYSLQKEFNADIKLSANLKGNFYDPKFSIVASAKNIKYGPGNFGSLLSNFNYSDNLLNTDIRLLDSLENQDTPALSVTGSIPLNLSATKDTLYKINKSIDLTIESDNYDLSALKNMFPYVEFQKGTLESDIYLSGTLDKPVALGYFSINEARFRIRNNNLNYNFSTKVWIDDQEISIESIELKNVFGTANGGTLAGNGFIKLDRFSLDSIFVSVNGDLKVLDQVSKNSNPLVYGDLALNTRGNIIFSSNKEKSYITIPINITVADLVVPLGKSAYSSSSGFNYKYSNFASAKNELQNELDSLIELTNRKDQLNNEKVESSKFNYTVDIKLVTEAEVVIVLSKELDQNLVVVLDGDFFLESVDGKKKSGGQLKLLDGSTLSFIKSFEAEGNIKFDKIDNPIIDVTSTYKDYYYPPDVNNGQTEQEVAVKIKLNGPLSDLNKNFINDENNIGVYMGRQAIEEDKRDATKNATDAMYFLIIGKFPDDENNQQNKNLVASTSTALAGSLLGEVLNQYFDDYIKGFQLRQTATETKFNLIGKAWKIKYEIGGSTEVLQDLSRANVKMEYPITERLQLRLERKESENQASSINNPLFFEGGFKYNFKF